MVTQKDSKHTSSKQITRRLEEASPHAKKVLGEVIKLEDERLYMKKPVGLKQDIADIVERIVDTINVREEEK